MSYKLLQDQSFYGNKLPGGKSKYYFDAMINGIRYRKTVRCRSSDVGKQYSHWYMKMEESIARSKCQTMLFEIFDLYLDHILKYRLSGDRSHKFYKNRVGAVRRYKKFFDDIPVQNFLSGFVEDYGARRRDNSERECTDQCSNATINHDISVLSHFFNYCIDRGYYTGNNPAYRKKMKEDNERRIRLSPEQLKEIRDKASGRLYTAVILALYAGLRVSEILALEWEDVGLIIL